jgi:hypothetical protein
MDNIKRNLFSIFQPSVSQTVIIQEVTVSGLESAGTKLHFKLWFIIQKAFKTNFCDVYCSIKSSLTCSKYSHI